jgi:hypothetical protein
MNCTIHCGMNPLFRWNGSSKTMWSTIDIPTDSQLTHILSHGQAIVPPHFAWPKFHGKPRHSYHFNSCSSEKGQAIVPPELALPKVQGKQVFVFWGLILWCNQSGNNPQKDLANFCLQAKYGNKVFRHPSIFFAWTMCKKYGKFSPLFFGILAIENF